MKISITLDVSHSSGHRAVSLDDLGITYEDWQKYVQFRERRDTNRLY